MMGLTRLTVTVFGVLVIISTVKEVSSFRLGMEHKLAKPFSSHDELPIQAHVVSKRSTPEEECPGIRRILELCPVITTDGLCGYLPPACEKLILRRAIIRHMIRHARHREQHRRRGHKLT